MKEKFQEFPLEAPPSYHEAIMQQQQPPPTIVQVEFEEAFPRRESCISKYFKCCG